MSYWLTTQYPRQTTNHPYNIYVKDRYKNLCQKISIGDKVVFYEIQGQRRDGRKAIIGLSSVCGQAKPNTHREKSEDEGDQKWDWEIPCEEIKFGTEISLARLRTILKWNTRRSPRVPGGVFELNPEQFDQIILELGP